MTKRKEKKSLIRLIHIEAVLFLLFYSILSKTIFIKSLTSKSIYVEFFGPYIFGVVAGVIFLYLFNHEDFFHFMKEVESTEKSREKHYLKKYLHYGKIFSTIIIATLGGPVFAALTVRFLLNQFWYKYLLLAAGNITSTLLAVGMAKGVLSFIHF